jgi:hypothetical protein
MSYMFGHYSHGHWLSLLEQIENFLACGIEPRVGDYWSGRLEEWLAVVLPRGAAERYEDVEYGQARHDDGPGEDGTVLEWTERVAVPACRRGAFPRKSCARST